MDELEQSILEIVRKKDKKSAGHNGNFTGDFDHILNLSIEERNVFLQSMASKKLIQFKQGANQEMIVLAK